MKIIVCCSPTCIKKNVLPPAQIDCISSTKCMTQCLLHNFLFHLGYKKIVTWHFDNFPFGILASSRMASIIVLFIIIPHLTLTQITMFSDFNTHTKEDWKRYAAVMINLHGPFLDQTHLPLQQNSHRLQLCTILVWRNSYSIRLNSPWLDHIAAPRGVLNTKVIVFSEATWK